MGNIITRITRSISGTGALLNIFAHKVIIFTEYRNVMDIQIICKISISTNDALNINRGDA